MVSRHARNGLAQCTLRFDDAVYRCVFFTIVSRRYRRLGRLTTDFLNEHLASFAAWRLCEKPKVYYKTSNDERLISNDEVVVSCSPFL